MLAKVYRFETKLARSIPTTFNVFFSSKRSLSCFTSKRTLSKSAVPTTLARFASSDVTFQVEHPPSKTLLLQNLPHGVTEEKLERALCRKRGQVLDDILIPRNEDGASLQHAYVRYRKKKHAIAARQKYTAFPIFIDGRKVDIKYAEDKVEELLEPPPSNTLFLNKLSRSTSEEELERVFSEFGPLNQVYIYRYDDGSSRGSGHVEFRNKENAITARKLRTVFIDGRIVDLRFAKDEPMEEEGPPSNTLFLSNFSRGTSEEELRRVFSEFGPLNAVYIHRYEDGSSRGSGYVEFRNIENAITTRKLCTVLIDGRVVDLRFAKDKPMEKEAPPSNRLFLNNLSRGATEEELERVFSEFGPLNNVYICRYEDGTSRGFAYVVFERNEDAICAREKHKTEPFSIQGQKIQLRYPDLLAEEEPPPSNALCLRMLSRSTSEKTLLKVFSAFGPLSRIVLDRYSDGTSKGLAILEFMKEQDAAAVRELHATVPFSIDGRKVLITYYKQKEPPSSNTLVLKNMAQGTTTETVERALSGFGKLSDVIISRRADGTSRGIAFVEFLNEIDAIAFRERYRSVPFMIDGRKVDFAYANDKDVIAMRKLQKTSSLAIERRKADQAYCEGKAVKAKICSPSNALFINKLSPSTTEEELESVFSGFGPLRYVYIFRNEDGSSRSCGIVHFLNENDAIAALERHTIKPFLINNRKVQLQYNVKNPVTEEEVTPSNAFNLDSLSRSTSEEDLERVFSEFGPLSYAYIFRYKDGSSRGSGIVHFLNENDAVAARERHRIEPFSIDNYIVELQYRVKKPVTEEELTPSNALYLDKLSRSISEEELERVFSEFGPLNYVYIYRYEDGTSRRCGIVEFLNENDAIVVRERHRTEPFSINNRKVLLRYHAKNPVVEKEVRPSKTLVLNRLLRRTTEKTIWTAFSEFTSLRLVSIPRFKDGTSRCNAVVKFKKMEDAIAAWERHRKAPFSIDNRVIELVYKSKERRLEERSPSNAENANQHKQDSSKEPKDMVEFVNLLAADLL